MNGANQRVIFGRGMYYYIEVPRQPAIRHELNLGGDCPFFEPGRFRVIAICSIPWRGKIYPRILLDRIGDIPADEASIPVALLEA